MKKVKAIEVDGQTVGMVVFENEKTLLIRKGFVSFVGEKKVLILGEKAVYVSKKLIDSSYWIRLTPTTLVPETINCVDSSNLIREFLNV